MFNRAPDTIRERGKAERRMRIVDAATTLLLSGGLDALTMRAISEQAGVSVPTIYNLVGGRDDVLMAVIDRSGTVFDAELATLANQPIDRCFELAERIVATVTAHADVTRSILAEGLGPMLADSDTSPMHRYATALHAAVLDAQDRDEIEPVTTAELLADQLVSLTALQFFRWATSDPSADPDNTRLRAALTHGIGLTLAAVTIARVRAGVLERITNAKRALQET